MVDASEAARLGLGDLVSFRGRASQEELLGLYRRAAIFALPCVVVEGGDRDGIPNVLMEAMATELPVVSSAISGIPELVRSGHDGVLVPERDVDALAGALERLLADAPLRRRLGENARATVVERFDSAANALGLAELFARADRPHSRHGAPAGQPSRQRCGTDHARPVDVWDECLLAAPRVKQNQRCAARVCLLV